MKHMTPQERRQLEEAVGARDKKVRADQTAKIVRALRAYPGEEIEGDPLRGHQYNPEIAAAYIEERFGGVRAS